MSEFQALLAYKANSRAAKATQKNSISKDRKNKNKKIRYSMQNYNQELIYYAVH